MLNFLFTGRSTPLFFPLLASALLLSSACEKQGQKAGKSTDGNKAEVIQDWPIYRGDAELQGVSREDLAPPLKIAWSFEPPLEKGQKRRPSIEATPVAANGRVFVGSEDGNFYALHISYGTPIWKFKADGPIIAPGAVFGDQVFFGDTHGFVYGLNIADGSELWRFETDGKIEGGINALQSSGGQWHLFVGSYDYFIYCLNAADGSLIWKKETGNYLVSTPSIINSGGQQALSFGGCDGMLHILPANGKGQAREIDVGTYIANSSCVRDGICYVADNGGEVMAIDVATGETAWKTTTEAQYTASPAVGEKHLYVAGPDKRLVAFDRVMGEEVWAFQAPRALDSSPVICPSAIWQGGLDGRLYAIDPKTGKELWNFELGAKIKASPAISRKFMIICGQDGVVYGFTEAKK